MENTCRTDTNFRLLTSGIGVVDPGVVSHGSPRSPQRHQRFSILPPRHHADQRYEDDDRDHREHVDGDLHAPVPRRRTTAQIRDLRLMQQMSSQSRWQEAPETMHDS